jgi:hypothetical protein
MIHKSSLNQLFLTFLILFFSMRCYAFDILEYFPDFNEKDEVYAKLQKKGVEENYGEKGKIDELNSMIVNAVNDKEKTASDYFILGNMFFASDLPLSISFMKKAEKLSKNNPAIIYERAIQEHMRKNCNKAVVYYDKFFKTDMGKDHEIAHARATDCYLRTKKYSQAIDSWIKANHPRNHIAIDNAIYEMFGGEPYYSKRNKILNKIIKNNNTSLFPKLIDMDLAWEIDWWNIDTNEEHLAHDLKLAKKMLKPSDYEKIEMIQHLAKNDLSKDVMLKKLNEMGIWSKSSELPKSPILMYKLFYYLTSNEIVTASELSDRFELELKRRVLNDNEHTKNLDILAFIYSQTDKNKLKKIDKIGWKKYQLDNYALSFLLAEEDESKYKKTLIKIAKDFPYNPFIAKERFLLNTDPSKKTDLMANMVIGEFPNVKKILDTYQLKGYIYGLAKQINHPVYTKTLND